MAASATNKAQATAKDLRDTKTLRATSKVTAADMEVDMGAGQATDTEDPATEEATEAVTDLATSRAQATRKGPVATKVARWV